MANDLRPDPDELLQRIKTPPEPGARLKVFFGMSPGVGKTYAMLKEAQLLLDKGEDVVIGWLEAHGRKETEELAQGVETLARKNVEYRGIKLTDMDTDAILARKPALVLIDELAHTNAPGLKHPKRYEDVHELLDAGISVYTTVNIQHLESIADVVEEFTNVRIQERIPDSVFDRADEIQLVDIPPEELLTRLAEGKVYTGDKTEAAVSNFFKNENLAMLREISLRHAAQLASHQLTNILRGESRLLSVDDNQRILVAISASPNSEYIIRWTRRFAYNLKAQWTCIYIETGARLSESDKDTLSRNMTLARNLGAGIVTVPKDNVVNAITEYATQNNVSILVIGKSGIKKPNRLFKTADLSERIVRESGKISVIAVQEKETLSGIRKRVIRKMEGSTPWQYGAALLAILAVTGINFVVTALTGYLAAAVLYLAAISLLSLVLDRLPVLAAACLSALLWDFLFIPPQYTFAISRVEDILLFLLYFLLAATSSWMTSRLKANERMLVIREKRMTLLAELSDVLETVGGAHAAVEAGSDYIRREFKTNALSFLRNEDDNRLADAPVEKTVSLNEKEAAAAKYCFTSGQSTGKFTGTLPLVAYHFVPMVAPGGIIGVIGIGLDHFQAWTADSESFLLTLSRTISLAVQREILYERNRKNLLVRESERLSRILLNSISHEMRTPLTVIQGSASALLDADTAGDERARDQLIEEILSSAGKLNGIVENLLSMNRLESGRLNLKKVLADPEDLVWAALKHVGKELGGREIKVLKPDSLPPVPCDIMLVIQVLSNLLANAAQYSRSLSPIEIAIETTGKEMRFVVHDCGPGVKTDELPRLFEKFFRGRAAEKGGTGLGLSICKGIVEAHGGRIEAKNLFPEGFVVEFYLPLNSAEPKKDEI
jgi:two-component system sensor histidine kinase KdpD